MISQGQFPFLVELRHHAVGEVAKAFIARIENLDNLTEVRVLNLAGNKIRKVENTQGLSSLDELNLRRNCIDEVTNVPNPTLQRIFLSNNRLR